VQTAIRIYKAKGYSPFHHCRTMICLFRWGVCLKQGVSIQLSHIGSKPDENFNCHQRRGLPIGNNTIDISFENCKMGSSLCAAYPDNCGPLQPNAAIAGIGVSFARMKSEDFG